MLKKCIAIYNGKDDIYIYIYNFSAKYYQRLKGSIPFGDCSTTELPFTYNH